MFRGGDGDLLTKKFTERKTKLDDIATSLGEYNKKVDIYKKFVTEMRTLAQNEDTHVEGIKQSIQEKIEDLQKHMGDKESIAVAETKP